MLIDDPLTRSLIRSLDTAALRQKVTAQNLSNLNTPGYKRSYVVFSEELNRAKASISLQKTNPGHLSGRDQHGSPRVEVESHTSRRSDGNNVDLDQEMLDLVSNQLRYNTLVQSISGRFERWRHVINEGRR